MAKADQERQDRLAQALRANLHRRKAQSRARKAVQPDQPDHSDQASATTSSAPASQQAASQQAASQQAASPVPAAQKISDGGDQIG